MECLLEGLARLRAPMQTLHNHQFWYNCHWWGATLTKCSNSSAARGQSRGVHERFPEHVVHLTAHLSEATILGSNC